MLLKQLEIQGFKSFPDKTKIEFSKGLTAVVGPNGSGKSNISDAVRWVMGEQSTKTLRGAKMEDVIFSGTKARKSQGFAEVSLTIDNTSREFLIDSDEVTITRRYDRSGESEYMINKNIVRLKDIHEMLMDTGLGKDGYSLVGQGKIAEIVQSKSTERREIFEAAAGISKFRYRRNEAERTLTNAEENLVRLRDILSELEGRIGPLKEQSEKAKRFLELSQNKKQLEVSLWVDTIERSNLALKEQSDKIIICQNQYEEIENQIKMIENDISSKFCEMQKCLVEIEEIRHRKEDTEKLIAQKTSQIAVCENDIHHNEQNILRLKTELENHIKNTDNAVNEIAIKKEQISKIQEEITKIENEITSKQQQLMSALNESEDFSFKEKELSDCINRIFLEQSQLKMTINSAEMNLNELVKTIEDNTGIKQLKETELLSYQKELSQVDEFIVRLNEKSESLNNTYQGHKLKYNNKKQKLDEIKSECDRLDLKIKEKQQKLKLLVGMEQSLEGYAYSVKEVIKRAKNGVLSGIHGAVSQLIEVKDEYSVAIETALGGYTQNIICDTESNAKAAIKLLKQDNLGRATFLPISSVSGSTLEVSGLDNYSGYIDLASNLVSYDSKFTSIIHYILGRTVIVDDIDTAIVIAKKFSYKFKIVTLDGQVVNAGGSLTGGSQNKTQSFLSRKNDIQLLKKEIIEIEKKYQENKERMTITASEVSKIDAEFTAIASEITTVNEDKIRAVGEQKRLSQLIEQNTKLLSSMKQEILLKQEKIKLLEKNKIDANDKLILISQEIKVKTDELNQLKQSSISMVDEKTHLSEELASLKIKNVEFKKDIDAINTSIEEIEQRKLSYNEITLKYENEISAISNQKNDILNNISSYVKEIESSNDLMNQLTNKISITMEKRTALEGETTVLRKNEREVSDQKEKLTSEIVRLEEKKFQMQKEYDEIIIKLWDEYELTKSEAISIAVKLENIQKATSDLNSIRSKIRTLGSVNVDAIEEYKEVSSRYEFLNAQINDAEKSRNELLKLINELTQKMQDIFHDNFIKINLNFKKIFVELFGGGTAELKLTQPDNLLESGIEIFVEPPGKIIKNLAALSGGEQAFVAIAIYFAILKVRPAPFCILDEIEAALDDVNVDKYASYLKVLSDKTQFIAITHRRGTMEAADILYGVTMQEEGVSKLLQLKVSEVETKILINEGQ